MRKRKSKFKGVCWVKNRFKWKALIHKDNKTFYLGLFDTEQEAAKAYNFWALKWFKDEAVLNEIEEKV